MSSISAETAAKEKQDEKNVNDPDKQSKLEARAKRKEAKKQNKGQKKEVKDVPKSPKTSESEHKVEKAKESAADNKIKAETPRTEAPKEEKAVKVDNVQNVGTKEGLSKAELKAQRREKQEAQRLAKATANNPTAQEQKNVKTEEKIENSNTKSESAESKAELRAKRRAVQEAQRLAKEQQKQKVQPPPSVEVIEVKKPIKKETLKIISTDNLHKKVQLFNHLNFQHDIGITKELTFNVGLHPALIRLGAQYMSHTILGSNARCLALLSAIKCLVEDYHSPPKQEFCRSLDTNLQASVNYLQKCRPLAVSMTNALRNIKWHLTQVDANISDEEKKIKLLDGIDTYIRDEIGVADKAISITVQAKIAKGDVLLTYGCSSIVLKILLDAHKNGKIFSVIVVDSRPLLEGREMLRRLVNAGIKCSYVLINAVSFIMKKVTKVLLGAHALLANGYVMSRTGTAQVALIAQAFNIPVLVCCETYKFCERVQTDSIVHNEIGNPDKLINMHMTGEVGPLVNWKDTKYVTPLNLMYDVTPPDLVTAVVTELAILPCTSVPVILRIKPTEITS